jgi:outer membrane protein TolC
LRLGFLKLAFLPLASAAVLLSFLGVVFVSGCVAGPNYHRPDVATAPAWKEQPPWRAADPKDSIPKGDWWTTVADDELNQYEAQALKANQTIEIARNQLQQARASARITQSGLFPTLNAGISAQRAQTSAFRPTTGVSGHPNRSSYSFQFQLGA